MFRSHHIQKMLPKVYENILRNYETQSIVGIPDGLDTRMDGVLKEGCTN